MTIFFLATILGLIFENFFFAALFFLLYIYIFHQKASFLSAIIIGLLADLFWVFPIGFSSLLFLIFLLALHLYCRKFNHLNQVFLLLFLLLSSAIMLKITNLELNSWHIFIFACLFVYLSTLLRKARRYRLLELK